MVQAAKKSLEHSRILSRDGAATAGPFLFFMRILKYKHLWSYSPSAKLKKAHRGFLHGAP